MVETDQLVAAIDVGKTCTRLTLLEPRSGAEIRSYRRINQVHLETPLGRQLDIVGIERWLIEVLRNDPCRDRIAAIVPIAHGAAAVLIDANGEILTAPDYEDPRFDEVTDEYERERDPFERTYSPALPLGLNLGRQLFYLEQRQPAVFAKVKHILTLPQFWAWRLSAVMASEVTSLGCHSDLWLPHFEAFSSLAQRHNWPALFPPRRFAGEKLGNAKGPIAHAAHLPPTCRIICGIHDSNASYWRYLLTRHHEPFAVISSGTWTIVMANKARLETLRPGRDMLANIDPFGAPVATARFMGGREYEAICRPREGTDPAHTRPTIDALTAVIDRGAMAIPAFAPAGPFPTSQGRIVNAQDLTDPQRAALATLYVALMTDLLLESLKTGGDVIIDGPLTSNPVFATILATLRPGSRILTENGHGTSGAICHLAGFQTDHEPPLKAIPPDNLGDLDTYRAHWLAHLMQTAVQPNAGILRAPALLGRPSS